MVCFVVAPRMWAIKEFKKPFQLRYVDAEQNPDFAKSVRKANCNLCHVKGEKKEVCNAYGDALAKLVAGNAHERLKAAKEKDCRDDVLAEVLAELDAAFRQVEQLTDDQGRTYGALIRQGMLPVVTEVAESEPNSD